MNKKMILNGRPITVSGGVANINAGDGLSRDGATLNVTTPVRNILTQSEFDSLSEAEKNSGFYIIDDGATPEGDVYSTEERRIGAWIDGKPLYRKVYVTILPSTASTNLVNLLHIDDPIDSLMLRSYIFGANTWLPAQYNESGYLYIDYINGNIRCIQTNKYWISNKVIIVLEYTKTTDSAVSIEANTIEAPASLGTRVGDLK